MQNPLKNRLLLQIALCFVIGLVIAYFGMHYDSLLLVTGIIFVLFCVLLFFKATRKKALIYGVSALIAMLLFFLHSKSLTVLQIPKEAQVQGQIAELPRFNGGSSQIVLQDCEISGTAIDKKISLYVPGEVDFSYGDRLLVDNAKLSIPGPRRNPGGTNPQINAWSKGVAIYANANLEQIKLSARGKGPIKLIYDLRARMESALGQSMTQQSFGAIKGMLFGDKADMDAEWVDAFQVTGIMHVLAVSGQHVGIVAAFVGVLLAKFRHRGLKMLITTMLVLTYCVMAGFSASVMRAALMCVMGFVAVWRGEKADSLTLLSLAALFLLVLNPFQLFTAGFMLSFLAVLGILAFYPSFTALLKRMGMKKNSWPYRIGELISLSLAAQLGVLPAQLWLFGSLPTLSLLVNVLITPFVNISAVTGLLAAMLGAIFLPLGMPFAWITEACMRIISGISVAAARVPFATVVLGAPKFWGFLVIALFSLALWKWTMKVRFRLGFLAGAAAILLVALPISHYQKMNSMEVVFLDVGQGDSIYIRQGNSHVLLDGGNRYDSYDNGERVILPFLYHEGVDRLDAMIASHADQDHVGGLLSIAESIKVDLFICGPDESKGGEGNTYDLLLKELSENKTMKQVLFAGDSFSISDAQVRVLAPRQEDNVEGNEASLVLELQYQNNAFLLTGDAEFQSEYNMMEDLLPVDVLKAGHHGSKNATSEALLAKIRPKAVVLSAGTNNRYRHPSEEVLARLEALGCMVYRTDVMGAIMMRVNDKGIKIDTMKREK